MPKAKVPCRKYVTKNDMNIYIYCCEFIVTCEWLKWKYYFWVLLYLFHMTYFQPYGWDITSPKKGIIE